MPDDKRKRGKADRIRIALSQPHESRYWCKSLGVTRERLRLAIVMAGPMVKDVKAWLIRQIELAR